MAKRVHLIFKTHLDIGFTDLASNVVNKYFNEFIPKAINLAEEARRKNSNETFIWTTGSWIVYEFLEKASSDMRKKMERAILAGDIVWHALPFTTHSELMDKSLFKAGLSLSKELDKRFGKNTIAAKMTDVPGHCRVIIPLMAEAGIKFFHIGINTTSKPIDVPPMFVWESPCGSEVIVNYVSGYGKPAKVEGLDDSLAFAHSLDNCGPPANSKELSEIYKKYRHEFQGAAVQASTLDEFGKKLLIIKKKLPVVTKEFGDTWIHGTGADPIKMAQYRQLCRLRNRWESEYKMDLSNPEYRDFSRRLLLVPEHTCGMDLKTHLSDYANYEIEDFAKARVIGKVDKVKNAKINIFSVAGKKKIIKNPYAAENPDYRIFESSWKEQRAYITESIGCLKNSKLKKEALETLREIQPQKPCLKGYDKGATSYETEFFKIQLDKGTGAIISLLEKDSGKEWCEKKSGAIGLFKHEIFSADCYRNFYQKYNVNKRQDYLWAVQDFGKPGLDMVKSLKHEFFLPVVQNIYERRDKDITSVLFKLTMQERSIRKYGSPSEIWVQYTFPNDSKEIGIEYQWFNKKANRIPEAFWMSFNASVANPKLWMMRKMEEWISPFDVIRKGNRALHALWSSISYHGTDGDVEIESIDAPLVSPGRPRILEFDTRQPNLREGFHFNLYNNLWGTNFPMWFGEDVKFRFKLKF